MTKDKKGYHILVIEDNPGDFVIVEDLLAEELAAPVITHVINYKEAFAVLTAGKVFDVVLLDLSLPDKSGQGLISDILQVSSCCPVIILTGNADIEFSIRSISRGIMDYLVKDELTATTLYKSIIYAIERKKSLTELVASEKRYTDIFQLSPQPMCLYEPGTFRFIQVNKAAVEHYGYSPEEFLKMTLLDLVPKDDKQNIKGNIASQERQINETYRGQTRNYKKNGDIIEVETFSTPILINDRETTLVIVVDVTEKKLHEHNIMKAIIKSQEDERYEIGGELHDNVCQVLAASQMNLGLLKKSLAPPGMPMFDQCRQNIGLALNEIRNLSHRLAPAFFDDSNLEEAFRRLFKTFNMDDHVFLLHVDASVLKYPVNLDIQLNIYRILQEQLRNIQKYARATSIEVDVIRYNKKLKMRIADNGVGFNVDAHKRGIGLANMKRRTELFSGRFEIYSSPGNGCTVIIDIPLKEM